MHIVSLLCLVVVLFLPAGAFAQPDKIPFAAPAAIVGKFSVIPLLDGPSAIPLSYFRGEEEGIMRKIAGVAEVPGAFTVFAVKQKGGGVFLIDAGAGRWMGDRGGRLPACLKAVGIPPTAVKKIFMTHLHADHAGGLVKDGRPFFAGAAVYVAEDEYAYWMNKEEMKKAPEDARLFFIRARECLTVLKKAGKLRLFKPGETLAPGLTSRDLSGHTPGHSGFLLKSQGKSVFFVGDLVHGAALQMPRPDITIVFDVDQPKAQAMRLRILKEVAAEAVPVAGAHFPFPSIGIVRPQGDGYAFESLK